MVTQEQANPFLCTFEGCLGRFATRGAMRHHKVTRHDYCLGCDLDFKDDAAFLVHKVGSDKHITCPVCSEDFKSTDGRDRHVRQAHSAEQNLHCVGCGEVFVRAGGLMDHFERNRCSRIKFAEFEKRRAMKEMIMAQMASQAADRPAPISVASEGGSEDGGGVALNLSSLLDNLEDDGDVDYPTLAPSSSETIPATVAVPTIPQLSAWPELGVPRHEIEKTDAEMLNAALSKPFQPTGTQGDSTTAWVGHSSATLFPNAPQTPALNWTTTIAESSAKARPLDDPLIVLQNTMDPNSPRFNPYQFRNAIGMFKCPYPKCSKSFPNTKAFAAHLQSPAHKGADHRCPACLKVFKSPTALTQHMEAPTNRCNIKDTANFGHAINLVSGGYLTVDGKHSDGTVKFETEEPSW